MTIDEKKSKLVKRFILIISVVFVITIVGLFLLAYVFDKGSKTVSDYYNEYNYKLPFKYSQVNHLGGVFFNTSYSLEYMRDEIIIDGHYAEIYDKELESTIFIVINNKEYNYYYVITQVNMFGARYKFSSCSAMITTQDGTIYNFLFPLHLFVLGEWFDEFDITDKQIIYSDFNEVATFYNKSNKHDTLIDYDKQEIIFDCKHDNDSVNNVLMKYIHIDGYNYLQATPFMSVETK